MTSVDKDLKNFGSRAYPGKISTGGYGQKAAE
jgi:hypothetical protein